MAGQITNLVAWDRRGWAVDGGDIGSVSFYERDVVAPQAPTGLACSVLGGDTLRLTWNEVTLDEGSGPESVALYRIYFGRTANNCPGTCTRPGVGFDYDHEDSTAGLFLEPTPLVAGDTYYLTVAAVDLALREFVRNARARRILELAGSGLWQGDLGEMRGDWAVGERKSRKRRRGPR